MDTIRTRYGDDNTKWSKTRNYIYQASDRLTLQQVNDVLWFLDERKCCCSSCSLGRYVPLMQYNCFVVFPPSMVRYILASSPRILKRNVTTQLQPTMQFLQQLYGEEMFREAILRNPDLLLSSGVRYGGHNEQEIDAYLTQEVGLTKQNVIKLKMTVPFLFRFSMEKLKAVVDFLDSILERGDYDVDDRRRIIGKIITSHPLLMNLSVETNLEPRMTFLMERCNLQERDAAKLIQSSSGNVLGLSVDENLRPTLDFLCNLVTRQARDVDDNANALRKCVLSHPQLLALSLKNLQTKVDYFDAIDRLAPSNVSVLACRVAIRSPAVYSLSLKNNVVPTVEFLAKAWGTKSPAIEWQGDRLIVLEGPPSSDEDKESLSSFLNEFPNILTLSLEGNIQPTLNFYNRTGYTRLDEDWRFQGYNDTRPIRGRYIAASLFNRLLPRWHYLIANGWPVGEQEPPDPSTLPPLHLLVGATDRAFCDQLGYDFEDYVAFKDQAVPRLKFSSQFDTWLRTGRPIDTQ